VERKFRFLIAEDARITNILYLLNWTVVLVKHKPGVHLLHTFYIVLGII
jgi:hypothetical protein